MPKGPKHQKYILDSPFRSLKCQNTSSGHYFEVLDVEEQFWTHFFEGKTTPKSSSGNTGRMMKHRAMAYRSNIINLSGIT
uniref:Uncharacterized protein n=1 Tax=Rhizophagus irregularis (strain DAOM 181602 / DAOM 197198 / MUCL 43194) TaxID=747089 RepID=U9TVT5_RHIID